MKPKLVLTFPAALASLFAFASPQQGGSSVGTTGVVSPPPAVRQGGDTKSGASTGSKAPGSTQAGPTQAGPKAGAKGGTMPPGMRMATPPPPPKPAWTQFKLNPKTQMFLDFTEASPDSILNIFSRTSGITIIKDPSFKTPMTVTSAKSVGLNEAFEILDAVLGLNGYEMKKQGNLMIVQKKQPPAPPPQVVVPQAPPPPPQEEKPVVKVYHLEFAGSTQVAKIVNETFAQQALQDILQNLQNGGGMPGMPMNRFGGGPQQGPQLPKSVRASADEYGNTVVVTALPKFQEEVAALVKELDKSAAAPLESQIFRLKYVQVDEVVDAIQNVLTANTPTGRGGGKSGNNNQDPFYGYYSYYSSRSSQAKAGAETATAVTQTNSVIVSATKANMELVKKLIDELDRENAYVGTSFVIHLENAKASDVAALLNQAFTKRRDQNQNDNPFFFFSYDDFGGGNKKKDQTTDFDENGRLVNVRDLTSKVNVIADPNTNSLIVVTQPSNIPIIKRVVDQIDKISEQVMIETIIVEANLDKTTKLGVEYNFLQGRVFNSGTTSASGSQGFGLQNGTTPQQGLSYTLSGRDYKAFVNALQTDNKFKVLSTPRIFTSNNVKAEINVSQKVPYIASQSSNGIAGVVTTSDFKEVGVVLTVTPRITAAGEVSMDVVQSADDLQGYTTFNAPIINHRQASTTATVKDGETIVLGGIIRRTTNVTENKIPLLGDIPLLGNLFKNQSRGTQQTELLVFLTPRIVRSASDARSLREKETKDLSQSSQESIKKLIPPPPGN